MRVLAHWIHGGYVGIGHVAFFQLAQLCSGKRTSAHINQDVLLNWQEGFSLPTPLGWTAPAGDAVRFCLKTQKHSLL